MALFISHASFAVEVDVVGKSVQGAMLVVKATSLDSPREIQAAKDLTVLLAKLHTEGRQTASVDQVASAATSGAYVAYQVESRNKAGTRIFGSYATPPKTGVRSVLDHYEEHVVPALRLEVPVYRNEEVPAKDASLI